MRKGKASSIDPAVVAGLCGELRQILEAELAAGNRIAETSRDWPVALNLWLAHPFRARTIAVPAEVRFRQVDDPHWWLAEYECQQHHHLLACRFDAPR